MVMYSNGILDAGREDSMHLEMNCSCSRVGRIS
jgi:hypothetical protein